MATLERENVSLAVHSFMEENGVSEFGRSLLKSKYTDAILELYFKPYKLMGLHIHACGSSRDGMTQLCVNCGLKTDMDFLVIFGKGKAYEERTAVTSTDEYQYFIQNCRDYPGYVTLQLVKEGSIMCICLSTCFGPYVRHDGQKYLPNALKDKIAMTAALADINNIYKVPNVIPFIGTHHQGPSVEHNFTGATMGFNNGFEFAKTDIVYAIPCPQWPSIAVEWITRGRKYGWPARALITKIERSGACLVPMGFKGSPAESIEWKYSFSHSEKYLIWSLNAVQFKCYAVLKLLKSFVLAPVLGDIISSYIIKTSLLWTVEGTPSNIWQPPMLLDCTKRCLIRIKDWVIKDFCPNYIMRECNLLRNRYTENEKVLVLDTLTDLIQNLESRICHIPPIMEKLQKQSVQQLARENAMVVRVNEYLSTDPELWGRVTAFFCFQMDSLVPTHYGACTQSGNDNIQNTMSQLSMEIKSLESNSKSDEFHFYLCVLLKAKLIVLSAMKKFSRHDRKNKQIYELLSQMKRLFQPDRKMKFLANLLYLATIYLGMNEYHRICKITKEIEQYFQTHLYIRVDITKVFCQPNIQEALSQSFANYDAHELNDSCTHILVHDVHFAFVEFPYLPQPIQFELVCNKEAGYKTQELFKFTEHFITAIDPLVYTAFLQFWCHRQLQNNTEQLTAIRHLRERCEHAMTTHKDIAWNLLGYCYQEVGQNQYAFSAFYQAWRHKLKSHATLLYIAILLNTLIWEEWSQIY